MTFILAVCVAVIFSVSVFLMLGKELKGVVMGVFLVSHAAHLCILAQSGSPVTQVANIGDDHLKAPPILDHGHYQGEATGADALTTVVDPLPQALILTAIVISFAVMAFLLTLVILTARNSETLDIDELGLEQRSTPSAAH
ncbi:MAG: NADH-quinone oxidoreductase subunit K [Planctomycetota bacterium]